MESLQIPDHILLRPIGRGTYGEVWLAKGVIGAYRAVKIISNGRGERRLEREFSGLTKFERISRSYDGFVDILHVGRNDQAGIVYYVMELGDDQVSGQQIDPDRYQPKTLASELRERNRLPITECVRIGLSLSEALIHLHRHSLIHRDVKPSNIIFVNGMAKLADIGLVTEVDAAQTYVGTEGFIPPEGPTSAQADIYSLGKLLYEISTGRDRNDFPALPKALNEFPDQTSFLELNEILVKACHRDRHKRYASAAEMHQELHIVAQGKSIQRLRWFERRFQTIKRSAPIAAMFLVAIGLLAYRFWENKRLKDEARYRQIGRLVTEETHRMRSGDLLGSLPGFVSALELDHTDPAAARTHRFRLKAILDQCPKLTQLWSGERADSAEFSPDGKRVIIAEYFRKARIYDVLTGQPLGPTFGPARGLQTASFSPCGTRVVTASYDKVVQVWNAETAGEVYSLGHPEGVYSANYSHDGARIVSGCEDGVGRVWNATNREVLFELRGHTAPILHAAFSPNDQWIVTTGKDNTARLWRATDGRVVGMPFEHNGWVYHAAFSPGQEHMVTSSSDRKARLWHIASGRLVLPVLNHHDEVHRADFSRDGNTIITASLDSTLRIWDAGTHQEARPNAVIRHSGRVLFATYSPSAGKILTSCADGTVRIWELAGAVVSPNMPFDRYSPDATRYFTQTGGVVRIFDAATHQAVGLPISVETPLQGAKLSQTGRFLVTLTGGIETTASLGLWDCTNAKEVSPRLPCSSSLSNVCVTDDGQKLITVSNRVVLIRDLRRGRLLNAGLSHPADVTSVLPNPQGDTLLTLSKRSIFVWNLATGELRFPVIKHNVRINHATFSHSGRWFVTSCGDPQYTLECSRIWDAYTGQPIGLPLKHRDGVLFAEFSRDDRRIVTASEDFTAIVWDTRTGRAVSPPLHHEHQVQSAAFSPDGRWLATAGSDNTVRIWHVETGDPLTPPLVYPRQVRHVRFSADGREILAAGKGMDSWRYHVKIESRTCSELRDLAKFLAGVSERSDQAALPDGGLAQTWHNLRRWNPNQFASPPPELSSSDTNQPLTFTRSQ